ncbi:hypothetical protein PUNSTDRAFT_129365 [Punctularia strigosozonata HHB-11173 SS5]|uniref:uncharacterized protein n=1 Tax=Punctularia strigosozonata (strain HHB-11173) TaxID=741275 RepID=UPI00044178BC|nr:uncharacterized protein PUNSTDRAFT_129365 [Punctularia strigosozonata HHB-11173 SS5]EIN13691.1 hypothetical protein PUNSTDRAFT_129365 [Punctularia strigosozonata HHB-11173 SS5]
MVADLLSLLTDSRQQARPFFLLRSSTAQTCIPVLRHCLGSASKSSTILLFCLSYAPSTLVDPQRSVAKVFDWTDNVPGYSDTYFDPCQAIIDAVNAEAPSERLSVVIDSIDTLVADVESDAAVYRFVSSLFALVRSPPSSRLIIHSTGASNLPALLSTTRFSASLTSITAYPTAVLDHLASSYLTPPPPLSPPAKFWRVFLPLAERQHDVNRLVFDRDGEGSSTIREFVIEVLVRGGDPSGRKSGGHHGVQRELQGWSVNGPCELKALKALQHLFAKTPAKEEVVHDPTANVSFNLNLTPSQQKSRAQVPLPYAHEGKPVVSQVPAAIYYDPDSADDIDDDDPDEDLDI